MTDTEILDWLERENVDIEYSATLGKWHLYCDGAMTLAPTLREAVEKAARENGDD